MFSAHSPHVSVVREQWDQLVGAHLSVKDPPLHTKVYTLNQTEDRQEGMSTMLGSR